VSVRATSTATNEATIVQRRRQERPHASKPCASIERGPALTSVETHTSSTRSLQTLTHDSGRLHAWRLLAKATPSLRPRPEEHRLVVPICLEYEAPNQIIGPAVREDLILKLRHEVRQYMEDRNTRLRPVDLPCDVALGELSGSHVYAASTCVRVSAGASIAGASWVGWARS
jgi:hypothetical protein